MQEDSITLRKSFGNERVVFLVGSLLIVGLTAAAWFDSHIPVAVSYLPTLLKNIGHIDWSVGETWVSGVPLKTYQTTNLARSVLTTDVFAYLIGCSVCGLSGFYVVFRKHMERERIAAMLYGFAVIIGLLFVLVGIPFWDYRHRCKEYIKNSVPLAEKFNQLVLRVSNDGTLQLPAGDLGNLNINRYSFRLVSPFLIGPSHRNDESKIEDLTLLNPTTSYWYLEDCPYHIWLHVPYIKTAHGTVKFNVEPNQWSVSNLTF
jgi:hypothetical protein